MTVQIIEVNTAMTV